MSKLTKAGHIVIAPYRCDDVHARQLKVNGELGQVVLTVLIEEVWLID